MHADDGKLFAKLNTLIEDCRRHPLKGTGKPEPLGAVPVSLLRVRQILVVRPAVL